jgi:perosamine synthetase
MIPLHEPAFDETDELFVLETLRTAWVSTAGPYVDRFEREFADFVGMRHAISVCNGTLGLQLIIEVLRRSHDISEPFDVIVPSLTFIATANAVVHAGGYPIFADAATGSMNMCPRATLDLVRRHYDFTSETHAWHSKMTGHRLLAVMPAHLMGWTCDMEAMRSACQDIDVPLLEDAAEVLGCYFRDERHVGHHGLAAVFSFNGNKILTTGGGGMVVTNDDAFAKRAKHLSTTAKTDGLRFAHDEVGYNFRLVNVLAALGCSQMKKISARLARKQAIAELYRNHISTDAALRLYSEGTGRSNNWLVNIVFPSEVQRELALKALLEHDIQARPLWTPIHLQKAYASYPQPITNFPNASDIWTRCLSVPSSPQLNDRVIADICAVICASQGANGQFLKGS